MGSGVAEESTQVHLHVHAAEAAMDVGCVRASLAWHANPEYVRRIYIRSLMLPCMRRGCIPASPGSPTRSL